MQYVPKIPPLLAPPWTPPTLTTPHVKEFSKLLRSGVVVSEIEAGNADVIPGQKGSGRHAFPCTFEVKPPAGYEMVADCARAWPSVWHPMHAAVRRFAFYPKNQPSLRSDAEHAAAGVYTPLRFNRARLAYGPCNMPLPDLTGMQAMAAAGAIGNGLSRIRNILSTPGMTGPFDDPEEGIFVPHDGWTPGGIAKSGAEGGSGIFFYEGWEQAPLSPAYHWLKASCAHERWWHAYDRATGHPITADSYGDPGPMYQAGTGDKNNGWLPEFMGVAAHPDPIIPQYDAGHSIRGFSDLVALSEMTDSPMVARMLRGRAAQFRLQRSEIGPHATSNYLPPSLRWDLSYAQNHPGLGYPGMDTGRQLGWPAYLIAQSLKRANAEENRGWCMRFAEFASRAAMPTGIVSRCTRSIPKAGTTDVWYDPTHDLAHAFEVPIFWHGAIGCEIQGRGPAIIDATRFAVALYEEAPLLPYYNGVGPPQYAWVAARGGAPYPMIVGGKGNTGDSSHSAAGCALATHLNQPDRQRWIDAALRIDPNMSDMRRVAGLVAQMQRVKP